MEEYVTRAEFNELKKQVEQKTEPIPAFHVNVASQDVVTRLDILEQGQKRLEEGQQEISQKQNEQFAYIKKEFASIEERQKRQDEGLFMHSKYISTLQKEVQGTREDLKAMATKQDLEAMKREILDAIRNISSPGKN